MATRQPTIESTGSRPSGELVKGLGLFDATMIVVGSMIGSGIFIVSADIAHQVQSPGLLLVVWLASGLITLIGALSFGELAAAMPHAGGQYVYLRESCGAVFGFLYGWTMLLVIQTATIAAVAIALREILGRDLAVVFRVGMDLEDRHVRAVAPLVRPAGPLRRRPQSPEPAGDSLHRASHLDQYARPAVGQDRSEYFHGSENRCARRLGPAGICVLDRDRTERELHRILAQRRMVRDASLSAG